MTCFSSPPLSCAGTGYADHAGRGWGVIENGTELFIFALHIGTQSERRRSNRLAVSVKCVELVVRLTSIILAMQD